jgi:hypothetical protein
MPFLNAEIEMRERIAPSRPARLGTRRRKPRNAASALPEAGASCGPRKRAAASLDTDKHLLATSHQNLRNFRDWKHASKTEADLYFEQLALHRQLTDTVYGIWQGKAWRIQGDGTGAATWFELYQAVQEKLPDEPEDERYKRVEKWLKLNPPQGEVKDVLKWERHYRRLTNCHKEWVGYRAECCKGATQPIAVPVGCNHRLCPLCAYHRSKQARERVKELFGRLTHPVMLTLTIPNKSSIRKHDFTLFRQRLNSLLKAYGKKGNGWILGGVYSIETTYNRTEKTWHIHAHVLADVSTPLPSKNHKIELAGKRVFAFTAMKLKLEFDWLRLWTADWGKKSRKNASENSRAGEVYSFESWVAEGREHAIKEFHAGEWRAIEGLSQREIERRNKWNARNRRVVHIRVVDSREEAAAEVLKYITKVADFSDQPEAVEAFCNASCGARLIQTFGDWYGVKLDGPADANNPKTWSELRCTCGQNHWKRLGLFDRKDVLIQSDGRALLKPRFNHNSAGTVTRPTIRALAVREE